MLVILTNYLLASGPTVESLQKSATLGTIDLRSFAASDGVQSDTFATCRGLRRSVAQDAASQPLIAPRHNLLCPVGPAISKELSPSEVDNLHEERDIYQAKVNSTGSGDTH